MSEIVCTYTNILRIDQKMSSSDYIPSEYSVISLSLPTLLVCRVVMKKIIEPRRGHAVVFYAFDTLRLTRPAAWVERFEKIDSQVRVRIMSILCVMYR